MKPATPAAVHSRSVFGSRGIRSVFGLVAALGWVFLLMASSARADSQGDELARWIDEQGRQSWGEPPEACDDLTFVRRVYLDLVGRVPSVSEIRDFQLLGDDRRDLIVNELVFGEGPRRDAYLRLASGSLARHWRRILVPPGTVVVGSVQALEASLSEAFRNGTPYDEMMREFVQIQSSASAGGYYQLVGGTPESYAGNLSRVMLGVRIDCAQCHDHPFTDWKQEDFWGLAAFYSDLPGTTSSSGGSVKAGQIRFEGTTYAAKYLWSGKPISDASRTPRVRFARWLTSAENPHFASTAVNRFWQWLVGRGLYADVDNLDLANQSEREFLDRLGTRFAQNKFDVHQLIAGICKSRWYSSKAMAPSGPVSTDPVSGGDERFVRELKVISPEQVFDSLEQSLHLPISRVDPAAPRWTGERLQMVSRLGEAVGETPEDYASGIPQALMMMNGPMTADAINVDRSRLLRAVVESPFFDEDRRLETLYLAVLTRPPTDDEKSLLVKYLDGKGEGDERKKAFGEILWALLNSPEFVLCR